MVAGFATPRGSGSGALGKVMLVLGGIFLAAASYLTLQQAVTSGLRPSASGKADQPVTLEALQRLTPGELADEERSAGVAFARNPLDASAVIDLSRIAEARGDADASERLRLIAGEMTPRAARIQAEALAILLRRRDFDAVMSRLDGLIRARPAEAARFFAVASEISGDPDGSRAVARMLASDPPWRRQFLTSLMKTERPGTAQQILSDIRAMGGNVEVAETREIIDHYLTSGDVDRGYAAWLSGLGDDELRDVRRIYDGGFAHPLKGLRFDWTLTPADGLTYRLFPRNTASMDQTLQLDFADFAGTFANLSQVLRLRPGRYRLSGEVRFENFASPTGIVFRIACLGDAVSPPLAETNPLPQSTQWIGFDKTFEIPDAACTSQVLQLESKARLENSQVTRGMVAIDNISIDRLPALAP